MEDIFGVAKISNILGVLEILIFFSGGGGGAVDAGPELTNEEK